jgi:hypothetical protein
MLTSQRLRRYILLTSTITGSNVALPPRMADAFNQHQDKEIVMSDLKLIDLGDALVETMENGAGQNPDPFVSGTKTIG